MGCTTSTSAVHARKAVTHDSSPLQWAAHADMLCLSAGRFSDEFTLGPVISHGDFSRVHIGIDNGGGERVVVKAREVSRLRRGVAVYLPGPFQNLHRELTTWRKVAGHPHIVTLLNTFVEDGKSMFVMEFLQTSLHDAMDRQVMLDEWVMSTYLFDMLQALQHIHDCGVVHCNVNPENFKCGAGNILKLCDFSCAQEVASLAKEGSEMSSASSGTTMFMAPEQVQSLNVNEKVDIWALGVIAYSWLFGCLPYCPGDYTTYDMEAGILNANPTFESALGIRVSEEAKEFAKALLPAMARERRTCAELLCMAYMQSAKLRTPEERRSLPDMRPSFAEARKIGVFGRDAHDDLSQMYLSESTEAPEDLVSSASDDCHSAGISEVTWQSEQVVTCRTGLATEVLEEKPVWSSPTLSQARATCGKKTNPIIMSL